MAATHPTLAEEQHNKGLVAILEVLSSGAVTSLKFPLVQSAFSSATRIFEISQRVPYNQDEFVVFAEEGCRLLYIISINLADKQEIEPKLQANLESLLETLQLIQSLGEKYSARHSTLATWWYMWYRDSDTKEIEAQRRHMKLCTRLFEFQSLRDLREKTNQLIEQHGQNDGVSNTPTNDSNISKNEISFGNNAKFDGVNGIIIGSDNVINPYNNNNNNNNNNRGNANANNNKDTTNNIKFGDGATFTGMNGAVFGSGHRVSYNSNDVYDNSTHIRNNGSHNKTVSNLGNNNRTHIGNNNVGNRGVIGDGSNNTVNSGTHFLPNARNFSLIGGEYSAVGGNKITHNYGVGHRPIFSELIKY